MSRAHAYGLQAEVPVGYAEGVETIFRWALPPLPPLPPRNRSKEHLFTKSNQLYTESMPSEYKQEK
jgi:hypothetical protein